VDWVDDPDSRVNIVRTARADLAGIVRLLYGRATGRLPIAELRARIGRPALAGRPSAAPAGVLGQLAVFGAIGAVSTAAYLALFVQLRSLGSAQLANAVALLVTAVLNTAANRRLTFGVRGREGAGRAQLQGLFVFALGLALTSGSLAVLHAASSRASRAVEVAVLVVATAAASVLRFALLRGWVFVVGPRAGAVARPSTGHDGVAEVPHPTPGPTTKRAAPVAPSLAA
jgi:putative flippase GtrA